MQDLKEVTRDVHYENYRAEYIQSLRAGTGDGDGQAAVAGLSEADRLLQEKEAEVSAFRFNRHRKLLKLGET